MAFTKFMLPVSLLSGAMIGAGIFALPALFYQVGLTTAFIALAVLTAVMIVVYLFYADVIAHTAGRHNFVGYSQLYLGRLAGELAMVMSVIQLLIVLAIYLLISNSFFAFILPETSAAGVLFWAIASSTIFWRLERIAQLQFWVITGLIIVTAAVCMLGLQFGTVTMADWQLLPTTSAWLLVAGPILFALAGRVGVEEAIQYFKPRKSARQIRAVIIGGVVLSAAVYAAFAFGIIALSSLGVTADSLGGLVGTLPKLFISAIAILGILKLWGSYVAVGYDIHQVLLIDLAWPRRAAGLVVVLVPALIYFFNWTSVLTLISLVGGVFLSLEAIFVLLMWLQLKQRHRALSLRVAAWLIILFFVVIVLYELQKTLA